MTMHAPRPSARPGRAAVLTLVVTLALAGCRLFTTPGHDTLTVELESDAPTSVRFITSSNFVTGFDQDGVRTFHLFQADTAWVDLPFTEEYDLRETGMYYVRVAESDDPEAIISLRALVDGRESFAHSSPITGVGLQYAYGGI